MALNGKVFNLKDYEDKINVRFGADTKKVVPSGAKMCKDAVLDFSECSGMKNLDLVSTDLRNIHSLSLPQGLQRLNCMGAVFPKDFVLDLSKMHELTSLNLYFAKDVKEVIISDKVPASVFYEIVQEMSEKNIAIHRENGEVGHKNKKLREYTPMDEKVYFDYLKQNLRNR
jgi:hypothetical protein